MNNEKFEITVDAGQCLVRIVIRGHWDFGTVAAYKQEVTRSAGPLLSAGCKGRVLALVDTRLGGPQSQDVVARYQAELGSGDVTPPRRLATIVSSALFRRQVERIAIPNQRLFADEGEALAWLMSPDADA